MMRHRYGARPAEMDLDVFGDEYDALEPGEESVSFDVPEGADEVLMAPGSAPVGWQANQQPFYRQGWFAPVAAGLGGALAGAGLSSLLRRKKDSDQIAEKVSGEMFGYDDDDDDDYGDDEEYEEYGVLGIALSKKAKGKKWARKWGEAARRIQALKRASSGEGDVYKKRKGPLSLIDKKKKVDVDKQIEKLQEALQKAQEEFRKLNLGMSPSEFLKSIGEEVIGIRRETRSRGDQFGGAVPTGSKAIQAADERPAAAPRLRGMALGAASLFARAYGEQLRIRNAHPTGFTVSFPLDSPGSSLERLPLAKSIAEYFRAQVIMAQNADFNVVTYVFFDKKDLR